MPQPARLTDESGNVIRDESGDPFLAELMTDMDRHRADTTMLYYGHMMRRKRRKRAEVAASRDGLDEAWRWKRRKRERAESDMEGTTVGFWAIPEGGSYLKLRIAESYDVRDVAVTNDFDGYWLPVWSLVVNAKLLMPHFNWLTADLVNQLVAERSLRDARVLASRAMEAGWGWVAAVDGELRVCLGGKAAYVEDLLEEIDGKVIQRPERVKLPSVPETVALYDVRGRKLSTVPLRQWRKDVVRKAERGDDNEEEFLYVAHKVRTADDLSRLTPEERQMLKPAALSKLDDSVAKEVQRVVALVIEFLKDKGRDTSAYDALAGGITGGAEEAPKDAVSPYQKLTDATAIATVNPADYNRLFNPRAMYNLARSDRNLGIRVLDALLEFLRGHGYGEDQLKPWIDLRKNAAATHESLRESRSRLEELTFRRLMDLTRRNGRYRVGGLRRIGNRWVTDPTVPDRAANARFVITRPPSVEIDRTGQLVMRYLFRSRLDRNTTGMAQAGYVRFLPDKGFLKKVGRNLRRLFTGPTMWDRDVQVACGCPDFRFRWHKALADAGASHRPTGQGTDATDRDPVITNPQKLLCMCKHLVQMRYFLENPPRSVRSELERLASAVDGMGTELNDRGELVVTDDAV